MFSMKDYLLDKSFKEEQYDNEFRYIVRNWFNDLLIDENFITDEKGFDRYNAMLNGKEYYYYTFGNSKKFVLVPKSDDLFVGDFDDIITFYKNDRSLFIDIKNKKNRLFTDTTYSIIMDDFNDSLECLAYYREFEDKDNYVYQMIQELEEKRELNPYELSGSLQVRNSDYWYKASFTRTPSQTRSSEMDSFGNTSSKAVGTNSNEDYDNSISMINIVDYKINRDYGTKKRHII